MSVWWGAVDQLKTSLCFKVMISSYWLILSLQYIAKVFQSSYCKFHWNWARFRVRFQYPRPAHLFGTIRYLVKYGIAVTIFIVQSMGLLVWNANICCHLTVGRAIGHLKYMEWFTVVGQWLAAWDCVGQDLISCWYYMSSGSSFTCSLRLQTFWHPKSVV